MIKDNLLASEKEKEAIVLAVVNQFRRGWERGDAAQILLTIANKEDMVMYGTDLVERWIGYDELEDPIQKMVEAFVEPVYSWGQDEPRVWVRGDVGWVCGDLTIDMNIDDEQLSVTMRSTFVVTQEVDGWKIAHAHFSVGQEQPAASYD